MPGTYKSGVWAEQSQVVSSTYFIIINDDKKVFPLLAINSSFLASSRLQIKPVQINL